MTSTDADVDRSSVDRVVHAPADRLFALLCDPEVHVAVDGSGMLVAAPDARPVTGVGDVFEMDMDREPLGDLPMGRYRVANEVRTFEPGVEIAWAPGALDRPRLGHVYGYRLESLPGGGTRVTSYCDWSGISAEWRARRDWPVVPREMLVASLDRLADLVEAGPGR